MHKPPLILAADDVPDNLEILRLRLESQGYAVATASDGREALQQIRELCPDLALLDVMMPVLDGIEVVRAIRAEPALRGIPVILVTAKTDIRDVVEGLDAGADDYLTKPFEHAALLARVRSMLRQKELHDQVEEQARQLADLNQSLTARVAAQVDELGRMARLRRFLPPQIVEVVLSGGKESTLAAHRREVTVVSCDLRGFTSFSETSEPEEVMAILGDYHCNLGEIVFRHGGTLESIAGDGMLVLFNDPVEYVDHPARAVRMALDMRERMHVLTTKWRRLGHELGFGVGISQGFVTVGAIGFEARQDYAAIGTATNLACRLCDEAKHGEILISQRVFSSLESSLDVGRNDIFALKGFQRPVPAYELLGWRNPAP
jgi:class 3 adenylate cyclase/CheY-like chemotaxis protein